MESSHEILQSLGLARWGSIGGLIVVASRRLGFPTLLLLMLAGWAFGPHGFFVDPMFNPE